MGVVKVIVLKSEKGGQWTSLLIDSISVAQKAVQDIVGSKISDIQLNAHSIYGKTGWLEELVTHDAGKILFKYICDKLYDDKSVIMNMNGGCIPLDVIDWEVVETKSFSFDSWKNTNLLTLLRQQNAVEESFVQISAE